MIADLSLTGIANLSGNEADLSLAWSDPPALTRSMRLVRRRWSYPASPDDGRVVFDLADLFAANGAAWARVDAWRFLMDNPRSECGAEQAELLEYYAGAGDPQPQLVAVLVHPGTGGAPQKWAIASVSRVARATGASAQFHNVTTVSIFTVPAGGTETLAGTAVISTDAVAPGPTTTVTDYTQAGPATNQPQTTTVQAASPSQFAWMPAGDGPVTVPFGRQEMQITTSSLRANAPLRISFTTSAVDPAGRGNLPLPVAVATSGAPITVITSSAHGLSSGARVSIAGATGNTAANGTWPIVVIAPDTFSLTGSTGNGTYAGGGFAYPPIIRTSEFIEGSNVITGQMERTLTVRDREPPVGPAATPSAGLSPKVTYYYAAFEDTGAGLTSAGSASVLATGSYGFAGTLFALLPAVHRFYDDPASGHQGSWQLRRFLQIFGLALDHARSLSDALPALYDPFEVRAEYLPYLAQTIGWTTDRTVPTERQRADLLFAPEVFATIGTAPNIAALASRGTGWTCQVKEFVNNVFLTNAVEKVRLWQLFEATSATPGAGFTPPVIQANVYPLPSEPLVTQADPDRVDARPAAVRDASGTIWLFWHSTRLGSEWQAGTAYSAAPTASVIAPLGAAGRVFECTTAGTSGPTEPAFPTAAGATVADGSAVWTCRGPRQKRRRIWLQRLGVDPTPANALADLGDAPGLYDEAPTATSLAGTIWLAWASNRGGQKEIWIRSWPSAAAAPGPARPLTHQKVDNRNPALACTGAMNAPIWAVWESRQSDQSVIWASNSSDAGASWSAPSLVSPGPGDRTPASAFDATNQLHVFWSADSGETSRIRHGVLTGSAWTLSDVTDAMPFIHDQAPAAVLWNGNLLLFWHSNGFATPWQSSISYRLGARVVPPVVNGLWYECTGAGTSGTAPPAFPTAPGANVADGTAAWTCRGSLADALLAKHNRIWSSTGPSFASWAPVFARLSNDIQPVAVVESAGDLRLFMASQETGARYRSRTFDTEFTPATGRVPIANLAAKNSIRSYEDRLHYTYDTRRTAQAFISRDTAGLYLTPADGKTDAQNAATAERLRASLTPFRPVFARLVYNVKQSGGSGFTTVVVDP
jgi:hypothetical protein